jgi:hypothetical protein
MDTKFLTEKLGPLPAWSYFAIGGLGYFLLRKPAAAQPTTTSQTPTSLPPAYGSLDYSGGSLGGTSSGGANGGYGTGSSGGSSGGSSDGSSGGSSGGVVGKGGTGAITLSGGNGGVGWNDFAGGGDATQANSNTLSNGSSLSANYANGVATAGDQSSSNMASRLGMGALGSGYSWNGSVGMGAVDRNG